MGTLHYGSARFVIDDRTLAHLQVVIALKLRHGEHFFLAWVADIDGHDGRNAIWIDNGIPIHCRYDAGPIPSINRDWIEMLTTSANTNYGLQVTAEGDALPLPPTESIPTEDVVFA